MAFSNISNSSLLKEYSHTSLSHEFCIALASYFIGLSVSGITFNAILIYTIYGNKKLHKTGNYFIVNLAACDAITCFNLAFDLQFLLHHEYYSSGAFLCTSTKVTNLALLPLSILSLLLLTFEKLLAFIYPFEHRDLLTTKKTSALLLSTWLYSILTGFFPVIRDGSAVVTKNGACHIELTLPYKLFQLIVNFALPLICILIMNIFIFRIAMQSVATMRRLSNGTISKEIELVNKWRRTRTTFTVVANESLCWFSYMIAVAASIACGACFPPELPWIMNAINYTSVSTNPLIYGLLNKSVRYYIWSMCCNHTKRKFVGRHNRTSGKGDQISIMSKLSRVSGKSERLSIRKNERASIRYLLDKRNGDHTINTEQEAIQLQNMN